MKQKLFTLAAGLSAVLCAAGCVLWVRSYFYSEVWWRYAPPIGNRGYLVAAVTSQPDTLDMAIDTSPWSVWGEYLPQGSHMSTPTPMAGETGYHPLDLGSVRFSLAGFGVGRRQSLRWVRMPLSLVVLGTFILPAVWTRNMRRRRLVRPSLCRQCGYDLRATPDRCPQCGAMAANQPQISN
jgi:hypothetical protein